MHAIVDGRRKLALVLGLFLAVMLVLGLAPVRSEANAAERDGPRVQMLSLTNDDRADHDRDALAFAAKLSRYAKEHSRAMADAGYLFHSNDEQLRGALAGTSWAMGGENVGVGSSIDGLEAAFMASKLHRENILRPQFDHAAIGIVRVDGRLWMTVIFYG